MKPENDEDPEDPDAKDDVSSYGGSKLLAILMGSLLSCPCRPFLNDLPEYRHRSPPF